ncbi:MAG: sialate O-acetylesterase [Planctomycetales bacterium]|jgi:sialate O-acetylesterase
MTRLLLARCAVALAVCALTSAASANVRLPKIFSNHMLLQRGLEAPVWGWADAGEEVSVQFAGQTESATADSNGKWHVCLASLEASSEGRSLVVEGKNTITLTDVLVGDVWICSGQSNMEWATRSVINAAEEIKAANYPNIRLFDVPGHTTAATSQSDVSGGAWQRCNPGSVANFSAVGYFFGRHFHRETGVPVGLLGTNWGGTRIEPWTPPVGFRSVPELKAIADRVDKFDPTTDAGKATWDAHLKNVEAWIAKTRTSLKEATGVDNAPKTPGFTGGGDPTAIYNSMVHGLAPYGVRGALWYQGESNGNEGVSYFHKMQALINGWRKVWGQGDFPLYFYFVQLADFQQPNDNPAGGDGWARLREAQLQSLTIPHTGMAVITDIGAANDIHPRNKQDVGHRLALWALRDVAKKDVVPSGPLFKEIKVEGSAIRVHFEHAANGLIVGLRKKGLEPTAEVKDGTLKRFAIAGEDKQWHWADAKIDGDTVVVSSKEVPKPVAVRYGFTMNPEGANLYNKEGLPASPFRSDDW